MKSTILTIAALSIAFCANAESVDIDALLKAEKKGSIEAARKLSQEFFDRYQFEDASHHLDKWEALVKKNKKASSEGISEMRDKILLGKNMLERVEKIVIIDSIVVDKERFFTHYRLMPDAGELLGTEALPSEYASQDPAVVYRTELQNEMFWSRPGADGKLEIVKADVLDDGSIDALAPLGNLLNEGGDADYLFMESDGMTFYFANNGENSLGGYDIFLSRRQPDGTVFQPQNMGMPYNSPYDDYMMAIDETANIGWWATDRNQIPGKVTIYVFKPNETRINYDTDSPDLADRAFVRSIAPTQDGAVLDFSEYTNASEDYEDDGSDFLLSLGNGVIYTSLDDFQNSEAASLMEDLLERRADVQSMIEQLQSLRQQYRDGDKSVASDILSLEKRIIAARSMVKKLSNQVISLENK